MHIHNCSHVIGGRPQGLGFDWLWRLCVQHARVFLCEFLALGKKMYWSNIEGKPLKLCFTKFIENNTTSIRH